MKENEVLAEIETVLSRPPDESGGLAIVLATAGSPPAIALLSTGDVHVGNGSVRVGIHASSSAIDRLGNSFSLLIPLNETAARVEVMDARARLEPPLALIEGTIQSVRTTSEPPWVLQMTFSPSLPDHKAIPGYLSYWRNVKRWLIDDMAKPPDIPSP